MLMEILCWNLCRVIALQYEHEMTEKRTPAARSALPNELRATAISFTLPNLQIGYVRLRVKAA